MATAASNDGDGWARSWPDALAFGAGLAVAWYAGWETTDLVWSLWLSSLVVGYAMIVWTIFGPAVFIGRQALQDHTVRINGREVAVAALGGVAYLVGGLFLLAFFTFHFGMFHFVHSAFLNSFFPLEPAARPRMPGLALYAEVFRRFWVFLPVAFLAERQAFRFPEPKPATPADTAVTAEAIAARKARQSGMTGMMAPYRNVMRMHLLIFFFALAHFAKFENFAVYAVVYAVYFFPWRLVRKEAGPVQV